MFTHPDSRLTVATIRYDFFKIDTSMDKDYILYSISAF